MLLFYSQRIIGLLARRLTMPSLRSHIKAGSNYYITLNGTGELERPMEIGTHLSFSPTVFLFLGYQHHSLFMPSTEGSGSKKGRHRC